MNLSSSPSETPLTPQQRQALATRDTSISLSAGAGCGKTFVLTERFISHVDPRQMGQDLRQVVAITFTDAAAREMRDRVRRKCHQRLAAAPPEEALAWYRLLRSLDEARISTIHSFCGNLVRQYAVELGLDPRFGTLMPAQADVLKAETIDEVLRGRLCGAERSATIDLATRLGLPTLTFALPTWMGGLKRNTIARWLPRTDEDLVAAWDEGYRVHISGPLADWLEESQDIAELRKLLGMAECRAAEFEDRRERILAGLDAVRTAGIESNAIVLLREAATLRGIGRKDQWEDVFVRDQLKTQLKTLQDSIERRLGRGVLRRKWSSNHAREAARTGRQLLQLSQATSDRFEFRKRQLNLLDFDDLIFHAVQLLDRVPSARNQIARDTKMLLVDEFQDTSPLQAEFVRTLCGHDWQHGRLFVVGDYKQSIYRFLGAEPEVFLQIRQDTPAAGRLSLSTNFRSQPGVIALINDLFADALDQYEPLTANRGAISDQPCAEFLWTEVAAGKPVRGQAERNRELEARSIAKRLRELVDSEVPLIAAGDGDDEPSGRAVRQGDIVLLFQAMTDAHRYEGVLEEFGFECYVEGGSAFYAQQEIRDVLNLLRCTHSGADEIALVGVLRSPFFAIADETIFWLAQHGRTVDRTSPVSCGLFSGHRWSELDANEQAKVDRAAHILAELRRQKDRLPVARLITLAINRTGYDATLLAEFLGPRKLANLRKLIEQARAADESDLGGLSRFILELSRFTSEQPREALATTVSQDADVVRLMTIHQSKGLEFPVVVVPDVGRKERHDSDQLILDDQLGPLCRPRSGDRKARDRYLTGLNIYQARARQQSQAESQRLLYVACTRAADHLILSGCVSKFDAPSGEWLELLASRYDLKSGEAVPAGRPTPRDLAVDVRIVDARGEERDRWRRRSTRVDLAKLADRVEARAATMPGEMPPRIAPVAANGGPHPTFSFSRLTGELQRLAASAADGIDEGIENEPTAARVDDEGPADPDRSTDRSRLLFDIHAADPRGTGLLVHSMLEALDMTRLAGGDREAGSEAIDRLARRQAAFCLADFDPASVARILDEAIPIFDSFLRSRRAIELANAAAVHREVDFLMPTPRVDGKPGQTWLTGVIDCVYRDAKGNWHVIDYKTQAVKAGSERAAAKAYEMQLFVYAAAIEARLETRPSEVAVHFVRSALEYTFEWSDDDRRRLRERLNRAVRRIAVR